MDVFALMEETLTYAYFSGVYRRFFSAHTIPFKDWRTLPCLAMVHPFDVSYSFTVKNTGREFRAKPGEAVFVPAHIPHRLSQPRDGIHSAVHIQYAMLGALDPLSLFTVPFHLNRRQSDIVKDILFSLITSNAQPADSLDAILERKEAAFRLLRFIIRYSELNVDKVKLLNRFPRIQGVLEYIGRNLSNTISRDYLAEIAGLSPARFNFLFREVMGMPPLKYVQHRRYKLALDLLRDTGLTVADVAEKTGYCDQFQFSRQFKKILGESPRAYRKALAGGEGMFLVQDAVHQSGAGIITE